MRIELDAIFSAEQARQAAPMPVSSGNTAGLKDGDIILASVERIEGDALLLRVSGGALLRAALQNECCFGLGDTIEAAVSRNGGGFVLTVLNVTGSSAQPAPENAARSIRPQAAPDVLAVLGRNPGIDAGMARFLAGQKIPDTAENIAALAHLSRGGSIGSLLGRMLELVSGQDSSLLPQGDKASETLSQPYRAPQLFAEAAVPGPAAEADPPQSAAPGDAAPHAAPLPVQPEHGGTLPGGTTGDVQPPIQGPAQPPAEDAAASASSPKPAVEQPEAMPHAKEPGEQSVISPDGAPVARPGGQAVISPDGAPVARPGGQTATRPEGGAAAQHGVGAAQHSDTETVPKETVEARIREVIRGLLIRPDGQAGARIKKIADSMPQALKTLKSLLAHTDINNKAVLMKSAGDAIRQLELADKAAKFEYMQLPLAAQDGEYRTAELYVFRQPEKRKAGGGAGTAILVALDTRHIGRVEALIKESGGSVSLELRLERPELAEAFRQNAGAIAQAAEAGGYRLTGMRFAELEKRTTVLSAGETVPEAGRATNGIDVTI